MDRVGLAGVSDQRPGQSSPDGRGPDLRPPVRAVHSGGDRRRGRPRRARPPRPSGCPTAEPGKRGRERFAGADGVGPVPFHNSHSTRPGNGYARRGRRGDRSAPPVILAPNESGELRDRLLGELAAIASADEATIWAGNAITAKNTLRVPDAQAVEEAFERRLTQLSDPADSEAGLPSVARAGQRRTSEAGRDLPESGRPTPTRELAEIGG